MVWGGGGNCQAEASSRLLSQLEARQNTVAELQCTMQDAPKGPLPPLPARMSGVLEVCHSRVVCMLAAKGQHVLLTKA